MEGWFTSNPTPATVENSEVEYSSSANREVCSYSSTHRSLYGQPLFQRAVPSYSPANHVPCSGCSNQQASNKERSYSPTSSQSMYPVSSNVESNGPSNGADDSSRTSPSYDLSYIPTSYTPVNVPAYTSASYEPSNEEPSSANDPSYSPTCYQSIYIREPVSPNVPFYSSASYHLTSEPANTQFLSYSSSGYSYYTEKTGVLSSVPSNQQPTNGEPPRADVSSYSSTTYQPSNGNPLSPSNSPRYPYRTLSTNSQSYRSPNNPFRPPIPNVSFHSPSHPFRPPTANLPSSSSTIYPYRPPTANFPPYSPSYPFRPLNPNIPFNRPSYPYRPPIPNVPFHSLSHPFRPPIPNVPFHSPSHPFRPPTANLPSSSSTIYPYRPPTANFPPYSPSYPYRPLSSNVPLNRPSYPYRPPIPNVPSSSSTNLPYRPPIPNVPFHSPNLPYRPPTANFPPYSPSYPFRPLNPNIPFNRPSYPYRPPIPNVPFHSPIHPFRPPIPNVPFHSPIHPFRPLIPNVPFHSPSHPYRPPTANFPPYSPSYPFRPLNPNIPFNRPSYPYRPPIPNVPFHSPSHPFRPPIPNVPSYRPPSYRPLRANTPTSSSVCGQPLFIRLSKTHVPFFGRSNHGPSNEEPPRADVLSLGSCEDLKIFQLFPTNEISKRDISQLTPHNWHAHGNITKIVIPRNHPEHVNIVSMIRKTTKDNLQIQAIHRIENEILWLQYQLRKEELTKLHGDCEEVLLFHGTSMDNMTEIINNNFDWRKHGENKGHRFGQGVSFSPLASYASHYTAENIHGGNKLILARVLVTKKCVGDQFTKLPPKGYDTTESDTKKAVVKFDDHTFYPAYVITYGGKMPGVLSLQQEEERREATQEEIREMERLQSKLIDLAVGIKRTLQN